MTKGLKINRYSKNMFLFHGSDVRIEELDLTKSVWGRDFGMGFYLTSDRKQAYDWAI